MGDDDGRDRGGPGSRAETAYITEFRLKEPVGHTSPPPSTSSADDFDADVLVVGLGPVGATTAGLCAVNGLSVLAVEMASDIHPLPRAAHFDSEVMRIFQGIGVAKDLEPHIRPAPDYEFRNGDGRVLMRVGAVSQMPSGWASGYMFHQPGLERVLRTRLESLAGVELVHNTAFKSFQQDEDSVTSIVRGAGHSRAIRTRYLIGCDGATSPVREGMGTVLQDLNFDEPWLVVDVRVGEGAQLPKVNLQLCDPRQPTTCVLMGPGRHRWEFMLKDEENVAEALSPGYVESRLSSWNCGVGYVIERRAVYRFHGLVASRWRQGRVLLAGDAAHQMPPFAGQGMCAGIRDASNLVWKLAAVLRGAASQQLLDSYQAEREPHVREVIDLAINMGQLVCTTDPERAAARDAEMFARQAGGAEPPSIVFKGLAGGALLAGSAGAGELFPQPVAGTLRLDDVLGRGPWLLTRDQHAAAPAESVSVHWIGEERLASFAPALEKWLETRSTDAVLVRPDRHVFGTGQPAVLISAYRAALS